MTLVITEDIARRIGSHGEETFPEECGGLLLGTERDGVRTVTEVLPLKNQRTDSRHNRVELSPLDYARGEREAARLGLGVWGFYHSHPDHPAVPSAYDLEHASFTGWSYLIVSIQSGRAAELRSWTLREDRSKFDEEEIETLGEDHG